MLFLKWANDECGHFMIHILCSNSFHSKGFLKCCDIMSWEITKKLTISALFFSSILLCQREYFCCAQSTLHVVICLDIGVCVHVWVHLHNKTCTICYLGIMLNCNTICVSMCHYYQVLPWWSWGEHSGCFLLWHASKCSLGEYTPVSGSTSFPQRTSRTQTWGLPSNTSHSYPSVRSTYTGELKRRREKWSIMKLLLLNWGYQVNKTSSQYNRLEMTGCASG